MDDRLYRSQTDRSIAGVAGGLAAWLGVDPSLVRIAWVLLAILSGGVFFVIYIVMMIVVPEAPPGWNPRGIVGTPGGQGGWGTPGGAAPGGAWTNPPGAAPGAPPSTAWPADWGQHNPPVDMRRSGERAGIVLGAFLVVLGGWLLVDEYVHVDWAVIWPVLVIGLGAALIVGAVARSR